MENNKDDSDYLLLSGIQHFQFCKRQWALIHIEEQWEENVRTIEGQHIHRNADQPFFREKRGDKLIVRAMPVKSNDLQIVGVCDDDSDLLQLTAQAMCLEEMLLCKIELGYLFYNEIKHRVEVPITETLRKQVKTVVAEMHDYYRRRHTPRVKTGPFCRNCSLQHICLPSMMNKQTVSSYIERKLRE